MKLVAQSLPQAAITALIMGIINGTEGEIFYVEFTKSSDGTKRRMVARTGVTVGVNGKGMSYDPASKGLKPVWDIQKNEFRMVNCKTVSRLVVNGGEFVVS